MEGKEIAVVVITARGVFFGYTQETPDKTVTLKNARMCIYWPETNKGVVGLAAEGPHKGARVGPKAPRAIVQDVTALFVCTPAATKAWESAPWHS